VVGNRAVPMTKSVDLAIAYLPPAVSLLRPAYQVTVGSGKPDTGHLIVISVLVSSSALSPMVMARGSRLSSDLIRPIDPTSLVDFTTGLVGAES
jgi:hypothetical protein